MVQGCFDVDRTGIAAGGDGAWRPPAREFVGISVPDLEASTRWYMEKLGMRLVMQPPPPYEGTTVKVLQGGVLVEPLDSPAAVALRTAAPSITHTTLVHSVFKAGLIVDDYELTLWRGRCRSRIERCGSELNEECDGTRDEIKTVSLSSAYYRGRAESLPF